VLRVYDATSGRVAGIRPAHRGELRVLAVTPEAAGEPDAGRLRGWLVPDLIRRCAERRSLVPTVCEITAGAAPPDHAAARMALNLHPPARIAPATEPVERTAGFVAHGRTGGPADAPPPFDIGTGAPGWLAAQAGWPGGPPLARHLAAPAGAVIPGGGQGPQGASGNAPPDLPAVAGRGLDPLALRLVLLGARYRDDLTLTWDALAAADKTLRDWRGLVAEWAMSPSAPMSARHADAVLAAFEDDLDTPAALRELDALAAAPGVPPGAKFETFAALDRLFGLDLARDIGTVSAPRDR